MSEKPSLEEQVEMELAEKWNRWGHEQPFANARYDGIGEQCYHFCCVRNRKTCACARGRCHCCSDEPEYIPPEDPSEDFPWMEPLE